MGPYAFGFVMEETLGHRTYRHNLARWSAEDPSIRPTWIPVPCWDDDRWAQMPVVRGNPSLSLSLRARDGVRAGLDLSRCDAILYHTQATALFSLGLARAVPVVVSLDATPINMDSVAAGYGHRPDGPGPQDWLKRRWYRCLFRRAAALTTWTRWARDSLIRDYGVDAARVEVIPPGVDLDTWRPSHGGRRDADEGPAPVRRRRFPRKGGDELLKAYGLSVRPLRAGHRDARGRAGGGRRRADTGPPRALPRRSEPAPPLRRGRPLRPADPGRLLAVSDPRGDGQRPGGGGDRRRGHPRASRRRRDRPAGIAGATQRPWPGPCKPCSMTPTAASPSASPGGEGPSSSSMGRGITGRSWTS